MSLQILQVPRLVSIQSPALREPSEQALEFFFDGNQGFAHRRARTGQPYCVNRRGIELVTYRRNGYWNRLDYLQMRQGVDAQMDLGGSCVSWGLFDRLGPAAGCWGCRDTVSFYVRARALFFC